MKRICYVHCLSFFLIASCVALASCSSDDEKDELLGKGFPLFFSPEEANFPAEGGTVDFVLQNNNSKTCGWIHEIDDYTFDPAFRYYARVNNEGLNWEDFLKEYPFYPYNWDGRTKHDFGWFTVGLSDDRRHVLVEVKPNEGNKERKFRITVSDYVSGTFLWVRQAGKAVADE